LAEAKGFFL